MNAAQVVTVALLLVALGAALYLVAPPYLRGARRELTRAERIAGVAADLGLAFSANDPAFPGSTALRYPFEIFSRGERQTCENVMSGTIGGRAVAAFDLLYWYEEVSEPIRWSCALVELRGNVPHVVVEPASPLPDAPAAHDGERVALEWGDFNARYAVFTPERGFAAALLDIQVMAWLIDEAPRLPIVWETQRSYVLSRTPALEPERFRELVDAAVAFAGRVPKAAGSAA